MRLTLHVHRSNYYSMSRIICLFANNEKVTIISFYAALRKNYVSVSWNSSSSSSSSSSYISSVRSSKRLLTTYLHLCFTNCKTFVSDNIYLLAANQRVKLVLQYNCEKLKYTTYKESMMAFNANTNEQCKKNNCLNKDLTR